MPAEFLSAAFEDDAATFDGKRGHRIGPGARRVEGAGVGEARDADFPFDFGVVRLKVGVGDGPIDKIRRFHQASCGRY